MGAGRPRDTSPILIVPYLWIGDFVRCHSVVKLLRQRFPGSSGRYAGINALRAADRLHAGAAQGRGCRPAARAASRSGSNESWRSACGSEGYGTALIMPRTWKAALAPYFAGIPERTGFVGEARFFLLNDLRYGEKKLPRMVDRCGALALPPGAKLPADWPLPELKVSREETEAWRQKRGLDGRRIARSWRSRRAPSVPPKRWPKDPTRPDAKAPRRRFCGLDPGRPGRKGAGYRHRRGHASPRPHRQRPARCHPGARLRRRGGLQRFRPAACRSRARHAVDRHIRPDQPLALGAAQSAGRNHRDREPSSLAGPVTNRSAGSSTIAA